MDWLGGIFEGTTHDVSGRQYNWESHREIADVERAIVISLAEEGKRKHLINVNSQLKEDAHLARALQESLKLGPGSRNRNVSRIGNVFQPTPFPFLSGYSRICAGCKLPIANNEFLLSGNDAYHKSCYKQNHNPKCDVCHNFIKPNAAGLIEYRVHPFWGQKYCMFHDRDGTPRCCSCERIESRDTRYVPLKDGRKLCLECLDSAIMDTTECQPIYVDIQRFYEGLNMKVEQNIPLLLVERQALNEAMDGERHGHYHMPETRGLCLSEEQTISTVVRQPKVVGKWVPNITLQPYKVIRQSEVTAILILYGLPRLLTGSILAHEMMHAWMRLNGYRSLRPDVEEGICQVLGHMWLTTQIASISGQATSSRQSKRSPFEKKLSEVFKHQIESDTSKVYGLGFRAANQAVLKHGLQKTLYHIRQTGNFPY
ncbi:protein DA1-related 1-like isoform X2 [Rutidosis leptorrhynchoides]|uniref:protein DA1-related 1-like isoform X2 n=1 Tax=Rutidosis leptorrhynchoides TaxID=125765 RepID=UPI003A9934C0